MPHTRTKTPHVNPANIPSIRLISATPSTQGSSEGTSFEYNQSLEDAWAAIAASVTPAPSPFPTFAVNPAPLAPRTQAEETSARKKLVPKKSKLSLLPGLGTSRDRERARDFSDVVRRVGADCSARGAFEIYVDPDVGEDGSTGEVVVVKKKKSRAALDGMTWGAKEVTNIPKVPKDVTETGKDKGLLKVKTEEGQKWWSIGRGRKDSKEEKSKENKISHKPPEPFKQTPSDVRMRFNSLDAAGLLSSSKKPVATRPVKFDDPSPTPSPAASCAVTPTPTLSRSITPTLKRSITPTSGGLLVPPGANQAQAQGSIAVRAMRSVRSLARIGSWAQLKNMPAPEGEEGQEYSAPEKGTVKEKKKSSKTKKDKENAAVSVSEDASGKDDKKKKKKSLKAKKEKAVEKEKEKAQTTMRLSSSSFEVGALTSSPGPAPKTQSQTYLAAPSHDLGTKKRSILGLGLPSSMRLPSLSSGAARNASNASSTMSAAGIANAFISAPQRLSAGSFSSTSSNGGNSKHQVIIAGAQGQTRRGSIVSTLSAASAASGNSGTSSLRPISVTSSLSTGGRAASVRSGSVKWDEEGLETVRERRGAERAAKMEQERAALKGENEAYNAERRTSRESKHSLEGRRRTSVKAVFPDIAFKPGEQVAEEGEVMMKHKEEEEQKVSYPILTIEEATSDGHSFVDHALSDGGSEDIHWPLRNGDAGDENEQVAATPVKKARRRPLSEQMLGRSRPQPMYEDEEGVLSVLSAATDELALLINNLDLQATPSTPGDYTPLRPTELSPGNFTPTALNASTGQNASQSQKKARAAQVDSPIKSAKKVSMMSSVSSLRPYAQSRSYAPKTVVPPMLGAGLLPPASIVSGTGSLGRSGGLKTKASSLGKSDNNTAPNASASANAGIIAQQIIPWSKLVEGLSPVKEKIKAYNAKLSPSPPNSASRPHHNMSGLSSSISSVASSTSTFRPGHKRTMTPAMEPEPELILQPLRPPRVRAAPKTPVVVSEPELERNYDDMLYEDLSMDLGSRHSTFGRSSGALTPVFMRIQEAEEERERKRSRGSSYAPSEMTNRLSVGSYYPGNRLSTGSYLSVQSRRSVGSTGSQGSRVYQAPARSGSVGEDDTSFFEGGMDADADPNSDIPADLKLILAQSDRTHKRSSHINLSFVPQDDHDNAMDIDKSVSSGIYTVSLEPPSPPPRIPLPTINAALAGSPARSDTTGTDGEDRTQASFDWTGALNDLNESGASDRRSFVEQLEMAFKTPAKVDLRYDFGASKLQAAPSALPPVPQLPPLPISSQQPEVNVVRKVDVAAEVAVDWRMAVDADTSTSSMGDDDIEEEEREVYEYDSRAFSGVLDQNESSGMESGWESGERIADVGIPSLLDGMEATQEADSQEKSTFELFVASQEERIKDEKELTMPLGSIEEEDRKSMASNESRRSEGELDISFKFGGLPESLRKEIKKTENNRPMTLSDIIPPPEHARRISQSFDSSGFENSSLFTEIYAQLQPQIERVAAAASTRPPSIAAMIKSEQEAKRRSIYRAPSRPTSGISFTGLGDSFDEARRNFEFGNDRPAYYPPAARSATRKVRHNRMESAMSIASVSSYGRVIRDGSSDPFDFGDVPPMPSLRESLRERPYEDGGLSSFEDSDSLEYGRIMVSHNEAYAEDMLDEDYTGSTNSFFGGPRLPMSQRPSSFSVADIDFAAEFRPIRPISQWSSELEDTFNFQGGVRQAPASLRYANIRARQRVESDASTFSFHAGPMRGHRRRESNMSVSSLGPRASLYNRAFSHGHRRNDSVVSVSSISYVHSHSRSHSFARQSGMYTYSRHRREMSDVSMASEFSAAGYSYIGRPGVGDKMFGERFERPGVGDKMFETGLTDLGPLTSITASPPETAVRASFAASDESADGAQESSSTSSDMFDEVPVIHYNSQYDSAAFDSIMGMESRFEDSDSIIGKTGYEVTNNTTSSDVFADNSDENFVLDQAIRRPQPLIRRHLLGAQTTENTTDVTGVLSPSGTTDEVTMLSMLGGGQSPVRRRSILYSPSNRGEKRKFATVRDLRLFKGKKVEQYDSPAKPQIVEKPSLASAASFQFGHERMIKAQRGLLERQSLEDSCLIADGEELNNIYFSPVFTRPGVTTRSRSSTCTSSSSGADSPPLTASTGRETPPLDHNTSDASSISGGSQSSIDLTQINIALSNATSPMSGILNHRARARARGSGHRRRYSNAAQRMSRSSVYETIDEDAELSSICDENPSISVASKKSSPTTRHGVYVVDSDTASFDGHDNPDESTWTDERGIVALRKYFALRDEAQVTVNESRKVWADTPFSLHALQCFEAPVEPAGMQALLEYSVQNFGPLPSELHPRRVRSRTSSRASPYPQARISKIMSPEKSRSAKSTMSPETKLRAKKSSTTSEHPSVLQDRSINKNVIAAQSFDNVKPVSHAFMDVDPKGENMFGLPPPARPRVPSNARRTALGWSKRSGKTSTEGKENQSATGIISTPGDNLRLNRPRPRGRATPAGRTPGAQNRSIRL